MLFDDYLKEKILVLDGAMGTMIQRRLPEAENYELLNLESPSVISAIHEEYIEAGADIIETNTFGANTITQAVSGHAGQAVLMAYKGACIAREAADRAGRKVFVAGSVGPTHRSLTLEARVEGRGSLQSKTEEMTAAFEGQIDALIRGGADMILLETFSDPRNALAALDALDRTCPGFPVLLSIRTGADGRTMTGTTVLEFFDSMEGHPLSAFGLNCSPGVEALVPLVRELSSWCPVPVIFFPDAGPPEETGNIDDKPSPMAAKIRKLAMKGCLNIAGSCCGTSPEYTCGLATALMDVRPRPLGGLSSKSETAPGTASVPSAVERLAGTRSKLISSDAAVMKLPPTAFISVAGGFHETDRQAAMTYLSRRGGKVIDLGLRRDFPKAIGEASGAAALHVCCQTVLSLNEVARLCMTLNDTGAVLPLLVGGEAVSNLTATLRLAPLYKHTFYCPDDMALEKMLLRLNESPDSFFRSESVLQFEARTLFEDKKKSGTGVSGGRPMFKADSFFPENDVAFPCTLPTADVPLDSLRSSFDWKLFYKFLFPEGDRTVAAEEKQRARREARALLKSMAKNKDIKIYTGATFYNACSDGFTVWADLPGDNILPLPMLRQESPSRKRDGYMAKLSIADFVPNLKHARKGPIGFWFIAADYGGNGELSPEGRAVVRTLEAGAERLLCMRIKKKLKRKNFLVALVEAGTAALPDYSLREELTARLREDCAAPLAVSDGYHLVPECARCGIAVIHPQAVSPEISRLSQEQLDKYAAARGLDEGRAVAILGNLVKKPE